jgi:hypothetical protein
MQRKASPLSIIGGQDINSERKKITKPSIVIKLNKINMALKIVTMKTAQIHGQGENLKSEHEMCAKIAFACCNALY